MNILSTSRRRPHGLVLLALAAAVASCAAPPPPAAEAAPATAPVAPIPPDFELSIGSGGGVVGAWRTVRLRADGSLVVEFSTAGRMDAEVPAGRLDDAARREAWTLVKDGIGALGCEPGNMTDQVETRANGVTQRACAWMGQGSTEFRRLHGAIARLVAAPAAGVQPPPPPLPPLPPVLVIEVQRDASRHRVARAGSSLPPDLDHDIRRLEDADVDPIWRAIFASRFYSAASIEERDGVPLPGAPYPCGADVSVRVTSGDGRTWETRQRCAEGDAQILSLADAVVRAAGP